MTTITPLENEDAKKPEKVEKVKPQKNRNIRAIYGRMVDPLTGEVYDTQPIDYARPSGWADCQIAAGKLELVG